MKVDINTEIISSQQRKLVRFILVSFLAGRHLG